MNYRKIEKDKREIKRLMSVVGKDINYYIETSIDKEGREKTLQFAPGLTFDHSYLKQLKVEMEIDAVIHPKTTKDLFDKIRNCSSSTKNTIRDNLNIVLDLFKMGYNIEEVSKTANRSSEGDIILHLQAMSQVVKGFNFKKKTKKEEKEMSKKDNFYDQIDFDKEYSQSELSKFNKDDLFGKKITHYEDYKHLIFNDGGMKDTYPFAFVDQYIFDKNKKYLGEDYNWQGSVSGKIKFVNPEKTAKTNKTSQPKEAKKTYTVAELIDTYGNKLVGCVIQSKNMQNYNNNGWIYPSSKLEVTKVIDSAIRATRNNNEYTLPRFTIFNDDLYYFDKTQIKEVEVKPEVVESKNDKTTMKAYFDSNDHKSIQNRVIYVDHDFSTAYGTDFNKGFYFIDATSDDAFGSGCNSGAFIVPMKKKNSCYPNKLIKNNTEFSFADNTAEELIQQYGRSLEGQVIRVLTRYVSPKNKVTVPAGDYTVDKVSQKRVLININGELRALNDDVRVFVLSKLDDVTKGNVSVASEEEVMTVDYKANEVEYYLLKNDDYKIAPAGTMFKRHSQMEDYFYPTEGNEWQFDETNSLKHDFILSSSSFVRMNPDKDANAINLYEKKLALKTTSKLLWDNLFKDIYSKR